MLQMEKCFENPGYFLTVECLHLSLFLQLNLKQFQQPTEEFKTYEKTD